MKRLRSSEDLESCGEKGVLKDWARREEDPSLHRSSSNRSFYYKPESGRKGLSSSSSRYDRFEDDRESLRPIKKRSDYDVDNYERWKSYNQYSNDKGVLSSSPRSGYGADRIHRSESFSGPRREVPKGFRSERDRSRREGSVSSWRRFSAGKDSDEGTRSGGDSARGSRIESEHIEKAKSPPGWRDAKSPAWSKDSGSEQSRSVEVKKSESLPMENGGHSSEMEEGELEPDHPSSATEPVAEDEASGEVNPSQMENESERQVDSKRRDGGVNSLYEQKVELSKVSVTAEQSEETQSDNVQDVFKDSDGLSEHGTSMGSSGMGNGTETVVDFVGEKNVSTRKRSDSREEEKNVDFEKLPPKKREQGEEKNKDTESKVNCIPIPELNRELVGEGEPPGSGSVSSLAHEDASHSVKDKGKSVAISPGNITVPPADSLRMDSKPRGSVPCGNSDMEGPSTRGLDLFLSVPVKKPEKADKFSNCMTKDEKFGLEPLELSLSLPNVLLPIGVRNEVQPPGSPSQGRSFQSFGSSFRTNSDGFTMSMSFSGSQHFTHNPSCSLTHNSVDYEQSVKSRPLFQGVDWQALASNEQKNNDIPNGQDLLSNGTGLYQQSQLSQGNSSGGAVAKHLGAAEGSSRLPAGLDRQLSTGKASRHPNGARSPTQSVGSHETGSEYNKDKKQLTRAKDSSFYRFAGSDSKELQLAAGPDFIESVITTMVSESIHVTARRFNEISGQHLLCLKEAVCDIITNPGKHWQLSTLQKALQKRSDITLETLLESHRSQLELLVALKTGLQEFLHPSYDVSTSHLADIFLNLRCRNVTCRSSLPVDECECKVCSQKNGFCSACMCLVCSKFDMASNTCSWVGCDVCLHWCHADCGLRESYIRNGRSASGAKGSVEMQFHCVACDHPSEMFGFVKEVFQNFAKEWTAEAFAKELEYVKRIFCASEDVRGKRLHEIANYMLSKLAIKADLQEVQSQIMRFFLTEPDSVKSDNVPIIQGKELSSKNHEGNNGIAWPSQGAMWLKSVSSEKAPQVDKPMGLPSSFDSLRNEKQAVNSSFQPSMEKGPVFDELESIVRIKQAEAKMFQTRADEARREADALKCIAVTKGERIEEEYVTRITKLRLAEAEDIRKQKLQELQSLERGYQEYFNMKMRMENNIKDLLLKMEATRRNLSL
ncbi:unnamed protein product [Withania somnifera]